MLLMLDVHLLGTSITICIVTFYFNPSFPMIRRNNCCDRSITTISELSARCECRKVYRCINST